MKKYNGSTDFKLIENVLRIFDALNMDNVFFLLDLHLIL